MIKELFYRIKRAILRALGRELENKTEQEVRKAFNKNSNKCSCNECESTSEVKAETTATPNNDAAAQAELLKQQNEMMKNAMAMQAMSGSKTQAKSSLKDVNEMMSYFEFDKDMNIVGVKKDAPDWVKQAYESGKFNE